MQYKQLLYNVTAKLISGKTGVGARITAHLHGIKVRSFRSVRQRRDKFVGHVMR